MAAPHWALLPIRPWTLADVAAEMSTTRAMNVGGITLMLLSGLAIGTPALASAEPFPDLATYLGAIAALGLLIGVFGGALLMAPVWVAFFLVADLSRSTQRPGWVRALSRALLLNHICLVLPVLTWLPFVAIAPVANPGFGLIAGKPAWIHEPWIQWAASPLMLFGFLTIWLGSAWLARTRIRAMPDGATEA